MAVALLTAGSENIARRLNVVNLQKLITNILGAGWYQVMGVLFFVAMALILYRVAMKEDKLANAENPVVHIN